MAPEWVALALEWVALALEWVALALEWAKAGTEECANEWTRNERAGPAPDQ